MENTTLTLNSVLCYDVCEKIQDIVNKQRLMDMNTEYFEKYYRFIEKKINAIEMEMAENILSEYGMLDFEKMNELMEWNFILNEISKYKPDPMSDDGNNEFIIYLNDSYDSDDLDE